MEQEYQVRQSISDATVLWVVESNYIQGNVIESHMHWYYHLFVAREGTAEFTVSNRRHVLSAGDAFFVRPGVEHSMVTVTSPTLLCYEIRIVTMTSQVEKLLQDVQDVIPASEFTSCILDEIVKENREKDSSSPGFISDYFLALADYLHRHCSIQTRPTIALFDARNFSELSKSIVQYMEDNLEKDLSLQKIADEVGYHKNYICAFFKQDTGMTIGNCLSAIRISKAAELLSLSQMSLEDVAVATGFINFSHFNRTFKKITGTPPGKYRRTVSSDVLSLTGPSAITK